MRTPSKGPDSPCSSNPTIIVRISRRSSPKIASHNHTQLHQIADQLQATQRRNFLQLTTDTRQLRRRCHEYTMTIEVERDSPT